MGSISNDIASKVIDTKQPPTGLFLQNKFVPGEGPLLPLVNPKDGKEISVKLHSARAEDVDQAVCNAREAFENGPWSKFSGEQRGRILNKFADLIEQNGPELAYLESICSGRPVGLLQSMEIPRVASYYRYYAGWADKIKGDSYPAEDGFFKIVRQEPLGVCAGVLAWNASLLFAVWKSAPALATGNTIILKPSEKSPLGTLALASLIEAAGFPAGVFQVVVGGGDIGALLASHMDIDKISFTGSTFTGRKIQNAATNSNLKRVTLELGGKSPAIIFKDANIDQAVFWATVGIISNSGQVCSATSRLFIEKEIMEEVLERIKQSFTTVGGALGADPQDPSAQFGPLVDKIQYDKVSQFIEEGRKSATLVAGGTSYGKDGYYVAPTIFVNPEKNASIWREEVFGPVLCVKTFETEEEALKMANDTQYGLAGAVFTRDIARALRVSAKLRSGTVYVNTNLMIGTQAPLGGCKASGIGRELGEYGLKEYTETKTVWINAE